MNEEQKRSVGVSPLIAKPFGASISFEAQKRLDEQCVSQPTITDASYGNPELPQGPEYQARVDDWNRKVAETHPGARCVPSMDPEVLNHPLYKVMLAAITQAVYGKGDRHGGNRTPFLDQPWVHYGKMHGRGFLTGQATKKLEEAASTREGQAFETEVLGAIVYCGMAILKERGKA